MRESMSPPSGLVVRRRRLAKGCLPAAESLVNLSPVDDVPPCVDVVGTAILVLQIVRMLPHVDAEDDVLSFHERTVLVRAALDHELAALADTPRPSAAEASDAGFLHFFFELVEAAERRVDRIGDGAARRAARLRSHDLPEHRMIRVPAAVVAHGGTNVLG